MDFPSSFVLFLFVFTFRCESDQLFTYMDRGVDFDTALLQIQLVKTDERFGPYKIQRPGHRGVATPLKNRNFG